MYYNVAKNRMAYVLTHIFSHVYTHTLRQTNVEKEMLFVKKVRDLLKKEMEQEHHESEEFHKAQSSQIKSSLSLSAHKDIVMCGYVTDVEGNLDYFERYLAISQVKILEILKCQLVTEFTIILRYNFSKLSSLVIVDGEFSSELTFENLYFDYLERQLAISQAEILKR